MTTRIAMTKPPGVLGALSGQARHLAEPPHLHPEHGFVVALFMKGIIAHG